ncbi:MAG: heme ABC exporter ATP-binding protein CcmA [Pseudomonadota bacterium]
MRLVAEKVCVARDGHVFFSGISFALETGDALQVVGPNGVGKSTFLRVLAGMLPDAEGTVRLEGVDVESAAEGAHYLGHRNGMKMPLSVHENLTFWQRFMSTSSFDGRECSIDEALVRVGLEGLDHLPFGYLSAGQQRRIAMARLLVAFRPLWLLDEPTAALDTEAQAMFAGLVRDHLSAGGMAIVATHHGLGLENVRTLALDRHGEAGVSKGDPFAVGVGA